VAKDYLPFGYRGGVVLDDTVPEEDWTEASPTRQDVTARPTGRWNATAYQRDGKIRRMVGEMPTEQMLYELGAILEDDVVVSIKIERN